MLKLCGNIWEIGALVVNSKSCGAPNPSRSAGVHLFGKKWIFLVNVGGGKDLTTAICPLKETKDLMKKINCFFLFELAQI